MQVDTKYLAYVQLGKDVLVDQPQTKTLYDLRLAQAPIKIGRMISINRKSHRPQIQLYALQLGQALALIRHGVAQGGHLTLSS